MHRIGFVSLGFPRVFRKINTHTAGYCLASFLTVLGLAGFAAAQSSGCAPGSVNFPCAYVANATPSTTGTVSVINNSNSVIATITVGFSPAGVAISPDNSTVYVANSASSTVSVIATSTNTVSTTITMAGNPSSIAITPNGKFVYVAEPGLSFEFSSFIEIIDTSNNSIVNTITSVTNPTAIAISPNGAFAYAPDQCSSSSSACVDVINVSNNQVTTIPIPGTSANQSTNSIAISPDGAFVYVSASNTQFPDTQIYVIDTSNNSLVELSNPIDVGNSDPSDYGFAIAPNGILYAGFPSGFDSQQITTVNLVDTSTNTLLETQPTVGNGPTGLAVGGNGSVIYVTNTNDNTVSIIAIGNNSVNNLTGAIPVGTAPQGVAAMRVSAVPLINEPLSPSATPSGGGGFTLTVNGTGFAPGSKVNWNGAALTTQVVSQGQLKATVPAANIASFGTASITATDPAPGGGTSNVIPFTITSPTSALTFATLTDAVGAAPANVVVADFDNDGTTDLAVINTQANASCFHFGGVGTISILLGNGDGTFFAAPILCLADSTGTVGTAPLVAGDFNGDGNIDLAATYTTQGFADLEIFLGNGDGSFTAGEAALGSFGSITALITGDFNGDGKLDLAAAVEDDGVPFIAVLLGDGQGNFSDIPSLSSIPDFGSSLAVGDFNGDGILDLAVTSSQSGSEVTILLGNGDGSFSPASTQPITTLVTPASITTGDFNGDGKLDLAVADSENGNLTVLLGNGDGTFTLKSGQPVASQDLFFVTTADFNGDGKLDLALVGSGSGSRVFVDLGNGDGTFQASTGFGVGNVPLAAAFADFNADGRLDLAVANSSDNTVSILEQTGAVSLSTLQLQFGNQIINTTSSTQNVALTNTGSAPLFFGPITIGTGFSQTNNCPSTGPALLLVMGASCSFNVDFTPTALGPFEATLSLGLSLPSSSVLLTGTGVAAPPQITTQPASQTIGVGQTATLTVVATGTAPLTYQWFQGLSGDTTNPISGATNSSFTTSALAATTSYWVRVSNSAGSKDSSTATVTVAVTAPPTCSNLTFGPGASLLQVTFTATCSVTTVATSINWGDNSAVTAGSSAAVSTTHAYAAVGTYSVTLSATDGLGQTGAPAFAQVTLVAQQTPPPVFAGQSSDTPLMLTAPPNSTNNPVVKFVCTTVTSSGGTTQTAASLGITCSSEPPTLTLTSTPQSVTIGIQTSGTAAGLQLPASQRLNRFYASCLVLPGMVFLGLWTSSFNRRGRWKLLRWLTLGLLAGLLIFAVSCGGGFTRPSISSSGTGGSTKATPSGKYFVTVVDVPAQGAAPTGFVQTSLIVPLTVTGQ